MSYSGKEKECEQIIKQQKAVITGDYVCSKNCRTCPFPGAKCVENPEYYWAHIK